MRAISAPRIDRISGPFGASFVKSTIWRSPAPPSVAGRRKRISPSTIRPGRSTILRIDLAVTLLPHPLSPTMPSVLAGYRSKLTPSTAFTVPSSWEKYVFRSRTDSNGTCVPLRAPASPAQPLPGGGSEGAVEAPFDLSSIGIGGVAQSIAQEVEGHD